jgi:hypothetical protein
MSGSPMLDDVDKLTLAEIEALRDGLLRPLLFEPVNDPGFERPVEKLRALVAETRGFQERLNTCSACLTILDEMVKNYKLLEENPNLFDGSPLIDLSDPGLGDPMFGLFLPETARSAVREFRSFISSVNLVSSDLRVRGLVCSMQKNAATLAISLAHVQCLLLLSYLSAVTERLTKGTVVAFGSSEETEAGKEVVIDTLDKTLEHFELPGYGAISHLFKAVLALLQKEDRYKELLDKRWSTTKETAYLVLYFKLWTDGPLKGTVEDFVAQSEQSIDTLKASVLSFTDAVNLHVTAILDLKERTGQFEARRQAVIAILESGQGNPN